jgi:hypothetical protein
MASRVAEVADALADAIRTAWGPNAPDAVSRVWFKKINLDPEKPDVLTGRQVFVIGGVAERAEVIDRAEQQRRYTVGVLTCERYTDAPGDVPDAWIDERVAFVEQKVFNTLADPHLDILGGTVVGEVDAVPAIDVPVDREMIQTKRAFWSVATFTFLEVVQS